MAVTQRHRTVVNPARRKLSAKQIAAGFGGKRRRAAVKSSHRRRSAPKAKRTKRRAVKANRSGPKRSYKRAARPAHRRRTVAKRRATRPNLGKIISYSLPKESTVATTKRNKSRRKATSSHRRRRPIKANTGHRRRTRRNAGGMGDLTGLVTSAVYTIAGAVGSKYLTQMVLTSSNTGIMGYVGNIVAAFALGFAAKMVPPLRHAAPAIIAGGFVQLVLRLINDYTPYGSYVSQLGMGDASCAGMGVYQPQNFLTPQRLVDGINSSQIQTFGGGLAGCDELYSSNGGLYA